MSLQPIFSHIGGRGQRNGYSIPLGSKGNSKQEYSSRIEAKQEHGAQRVRCAYFDNAVVIAKPTLDALSPDAELIHEAAIGKIAGEQILKLRTLGLEQDEAERAIINGFLS